MPVFIFPVNIAGYKHFYTSTVQPFLLCRIQRSIVDSTYNGQPCSKYNFRIHNDVFQGNFGHILI